MVMDHFQLGQIYGFDFSVENALSNLLTERFVTHYLWNTDTPQIRRVLASDTCRVRHQHSTDTYNYTQLCDFHKLL